MGNIKQNHISELDLLLIDDKYWDFMLSNNTGDGSAICFDTISYIDLREPECYMNGNLLSHPDFIWSESINNDVVLNNIGLTGIDNGLIHYNPYEIDKADFLDILTNSKIDLTLLGKKLELHPIRSNTYFYSYPIEYIDDYVALKGGFYQGFFKLFERDYEVLPYRLEDEWNLEFKIRPKDYEPSKTTINSVHPENKGIFFYMGTRAENKFWELYDVDNSEFTKIERNDYVTCIEPLVTDEFCYVEDKYLIDRDDYFPQYTMDDYVDCEIPLPNALNCYVEDGYLITADEEILTDNGYEMDVCNVYEVTTDNKFLLFNQTENGYTTKNWVEGTEVTFSGIEKPKNINYFLLFNQTENGYTTDTIDDYLETIQYKYEPIKDIFNNSFALKINDDGSIGYKFMVKNCNIDVDEEYEILEEYSKPNIIIKDDWNIINVKIVNVSKNNELNCNDSFTESVTEKMKIYFYVNNNLVFISKELPIFNFKPLDDIPEKQEGVPFNISLGGGTQGLMERIWMNYLELPKYILPIEKNFGGSFIGDFQYFKFKIISGC